MNSLFRNTANPLTGPDGRIVGLDGLRAFSIGLVLLGHLAGTVGAPRLLDPFHSLGNYGVRFFFVISGFLITWLLLKELDRSGNVDLRRFFLNRVFRIFPAFYAYIAIGALLAWFGWVDLNPGDLLHAATYTMNFHEDRAWHFNHTWSLAVEEQFYLLWPFALLFLGRKWAPLLLIFVVLAVPVVRSVMWYGYEVSPSGMMRQFQAVADSLACGCLLAFAYRGGYVPRLNGVAARGLVWLFAICLFVGSAAVYKFDPGVFYVLGQSLANVAAALTIHLCITVQGGLLSKALNNRAVVWIGVLSYSLYLWQEPFLNSYATGWAQSFPVNLGLTFAAAIASYFLIEKPFLVLKDRSGVGLSCMRWLGSGLGRVANRKALLCIVIAVFASVSAFAMQRLQPLNSVEIDPIGSAGELHEDSIFVVEGVNRGTAVATVVVQIEDRDAPAYHNRANKEFEAPPGPFRFQVSLGGLRAGNGRMMKLVDLSRIVAHTTAQDIHFDRLNTKTLRPRLLPIGAFGWDFGPDHAAVAPGFSKVTPGSPSLRGIKLTARTRPSGDALSSDGISGIERFETHLPNGRWRIALWTEDIGDWQMLPYWTRRRIAINGTVAAEETRTAEQWFDEIYSAGAEAEAIVDGDPWDLFAGRRGGIVKTEIVVRDSRLIVEMAGDLSAASHIAAIIASPIPDTDSLETVTQWRQQLFLEKWRYDRKEPGPVPVALTVHERPDDGTAPEATQMNWRLARNDSSASDIWVALPPEHEQFSVTFHPDAGWPSSLDLDIRYGDWQFRRASPAGTYLRIVADRLHPVQGPVRNAFPLSRRLNLRLTSGGDVSPGRYSAKLDIQGGKGRNLIPIDVTVLDISLPEADRPIGIFLEEAPHLTWFGAFKPLRERAVECDLALLNGFGLTGIAPPLSKTREEFHAQHLRVADIVSSNGFPGPIIAYASLKQAEREIGIEMAAYSMQAVDAALAVRSVPPVHWSIADEPRNAGAGYADLRQRASTIRKIAPELRLTGFLNNPGDRETLELFDSVFINPGFGVDVKDVAAVQEAGPEPWFYNMNNPRLAAGLHLWRTGARGYLQWHGRMPTADPYDPTDGREDDFQYLYPSRDPCTVQVIHEDLLALSEGITDYRWLLWLDGLAATVPEARRLREKLLSEIPKHWQSAHQLTNQEIGSHRDRIKDLAEREARRK